MAAGGIHDHLGGGFARYATDTEWLVPHFEKMLYDQAGLLRAYLHGWQVTGDPAYLGVAEGIVAYVTRDLTAPEGGVYSAEDADSEGVEGKFYVWTPDEVPTRRPATPSWPTAVREWFDITPGGNFEGATILRRPVGAPARSAPSQSKSAGAACSPAGHSGCARASTTRSSRSGTPCTPRRWPRPPPQRGAPTGPRPRWASPEFLWDHLRDADGRWLRSWQRDGGARHLAYAADHAWLVDCFTRMGELTGRSVWTDRATATADALIARFADPEGGGFFTTASDAEQLIVRTKDVFDGATPSANAVAAAALARLGALTGNEALHRARPEGGGPHRRPTHPSPDGLRPHRPDGRPAGSGRDRGGRDRRPARPGRRGPAPLAARRRGGLGRADRLAAVGRSGPGPGLRLPGLRLPGAGGDAATLAGQLRGPGPRPGVRAC